jgi:hypothetical protein
MILLIQWILTLLTINATNSTINAVQITVHVGAQTIHVVEINNTIVAMVDTPKHVSKHVIIVENMVIGPETVIKSNVINQTSSTTLLMRQ